MLVKDHEGREVEITGYEYDDGCIYITDAYYTDDGRDASIEVLDELTDRYQSALLEQAGDIGYMQQSDREYEKEYC